MKKFLFFTFLFSGGVVALFLYKGYNNTDFKYFKDLLNATISIGSIGVGFLAAAVTLMPSQQSNPFLITLKKIKGYSKLLDSLLLGIATLFITCLISVIGLFFNIETDSLIPKIYFYTWLFIFVFTMLNIAYVIGIFLYYLRSASKDD